MKLEQDFYLREDVLQVSRDLLGKYLFTNINGILTGGIIVETEAYRAPEDKASHAFANKRTPRTEGFYREGGISYVYMCYGIHYLFNIITNFEDVPHAILIRAVEPIKGVELMMERRNMTKPLYNLTAGPGALSKALGIGKEHNGLSLQSDVIWIEDRNLSISPSEIIAGPRVGIAYAEEYASKPWRFSIAGNKWVSKAK